MNILITGNGTIGKAFARYLGDVTVIDNSEWNIAEEDNVHYKLMDFSEWKFADNPVDLVIHTAAFKHINLGEQNVEAFIENNIYKTQKLFKEASKHGADILFISTDKAVEPCSLYGYTKAIGEHLTKTYGGAIARLGNVKGSSGSVLARWEEAYSKGKPIPITDTRMERYFIDVDEAVEQIWHGYKAGEKLIIPDMPLRNILDIKNELYGYDYPIEIIGKRPGEKLEEKLRWDKEER